MSKSYQDCRCGGYTSEEKIFHTPGCSVPYSPGSRQQQDMIIALYKKYSIPHEEIDHIIEMANLEKPFSSMEFHHNVSLGLRKKIELILAKNERHKDREIHKCINEYNSYVMDNSISSIRYQTEPYI